MGRSRKKIGPNLPIKFGPAIVTHCAGWGTIKTMTIKNNIPYQTHGVKNKLQHTGDTNDFNGHTQPWMRTRPFMPAGSEDVARKYEQPNGRLLLVKKNGRKKFDVAELQMNGDNYYGVTTWFLEDKNPGKIPYEERSNRKLLLRLAQAALDGAPYPQYESYIRYGRYANG